MRIRKRSLTFIIVLAIVLFVIGAVVDWKAGNQIKRKVDSFSDANYLEPASETERSITASEPFSWLEVDLNATSKLQLFINFNGQMQYYKNESTLKNTFLLNDAGKYIVIFLNNSSDRIHYDYNLYLTTATTQTVHPFAWLVMPSYLSGEVALVAMLPVTFFDDVKKKWNKTATEVIVLSTIIGFVPIMTLVTGTSLPVVSPTSGSMRPTIYPGDLVIVGGATNSSLNIGDILIYDKMVTNLSDPIVEQSSYTIMHRIVGTIYQNGTLYYHTKGDYNPNADDWYVPQEGIQGKAILVIPYIGIVILMLSQLYVKILLIAIIVIVVIIWPNQKSKKPKLWVEKK
jgi:signal peptidase I